MSDLTLLNQPSTGKWVKAQLYRRYATVGGIQQTYTMLVKRVNNIDFLAFFAHVEPGEIKALPDLTKGEKDIELMKMTKGVLFTYGYKPGRLVWYNLATHELKERSK